MEWLVNAFFIKDSSLPRDGGLVNDIAFTSLGGLWFGLAEWALFGDNALISASVVPMSAEGVRHHCGTTETLVTYEAQVIMYCPQVVDDGPLVLSVLAVPRAVSITGETCWRAWESWIPFRPMILGDSLVDTALRNFNPLGRHQRT